MLAQATEPIPLETDEQGVIRVGGTRVPLETIVTLFEAGATPEEIAQDFPVLRLDDVYAVITYFLRHRSSVETYLQSRQRKAHQIRQKWATRIDQTGLRKRLRARFENLQGV